MHEILSLSVFPFLSGKNFNRFSKWQNTHKTLIDYQLTSSAITRLCQKISDNERMNLIKLRINRLPKQSYVDCDSTTRSAWGKGLADIRWGRNKDNEKLKNTIETTVYSLENHEPFYYRLFPGNISDISTVRTIISDLKLFNIKDLLFISDRGYISEENLASLVGVDVSFIISSKINNKIILTFIETILYDNEGFPTNMEFDEDKKLFYRQFTVPDYNSHMSNGTNIEIKGLKVNIYLDFSARFNEILLIKNKINKEKVIIEKDVAENNIPIDFKKYNALFDYYKIKPIKDKNNKTIALTYEEYNEKIKKGDIESRFLFLLYI